jgi:hypothetical protein
VVRHNIKKIKNFFTDISKNFISNYIYKIVAAGFIFAFAFTNISTQFVNAIGGQVQSRSIQLSNATPSATGVSYQTQFYPTAVTAVGGITVDFCANDPIIGDTCTAATAPFSVGATPTFTGPTGIGVGGSWVASSNAAHNLFYLTNTTAQAPTGITTFINFTITNVTNPGGTAGSFYARIITWDTSAHALAYTSGETGTLTGELDYGGVALSTVNQITITVKVQEQITFCVYTAALDLGSCNAATGSTIALGNANGVLSTAGPYVDITTKYDLQTNALHGDTVRFTGTVPTSGSNVIEASTLSGTGAVAATGYATSATVPQFGLCTYPAAGTTTNVTIAATYASNGGSTYNGTEAGDACFTQTTQSSGTGTTGGAGTATFGFNIAAAATSGYGDTLLTGIAGGYTQGVIAFIGNILPATVAGIYTNTLTFVATGTY